MDHCVTGIRKPDMLTGMTEREWSVVLEVDHGKDSCGILIQQPLTRVLADGRRQGGGTVAARAAC